MDDVLIGIIFMCIMVQWDKLIWGLEIIGKISHVENILIRMLFHVVNFLDKMKLSHFMG